MAARSKDKYYNILALDGGAIRGVITTETLKEIETFTYDYATSKGYQIPTHKGGEGKMHMIDLFDMFAGTSAGSI